MNKTGRIHSFETCGTVDGPGIRFVVFLQGCPARCQYCHNPDTWNPGEGRVVSVDEVIAEAAKYSSYMEHSGGGITLSGGEPLMQPEFVLETFKACRQQGIHTALDTAGFGPWEENREIFDYTDLVLLDLKCLDKETHHSLTGMSGEHVTGLMDYLFSINKPVWVRYVLVPGVTDDHELLINTAEFIVLHANIKIIDILPFHKLGQYKWEELGHEFQLTDTPSPTAAQLEDAKNVFKSYGLEVR